MAEYLDDQVQVDDDNDSVQYEDFEDVDPSRAALDLQRTSKEQLEDERDIVAIVSAIGRDEAEVDADGQPTGRRKFTLGPEAMQCMRWLASKLKDDSASLFTRLVLGRCCNLVDVLLKVVNEHVAELDVMHQVVKVLALVVDPAMWLETDCQGKLPGTPPERAEHMELLRSYKQKFLDPQVPSAFASLLAEAVENHEELGKDNPDTLMCSRVLLLFYSLLAVPNANAKTARLHVAHTHLHEDFLLTLEESDVLQVFLTFSSFTTFTPYFLWLMLKIWYFVLHTFDAADLYRAADTMAAARAVEEKQQRQLEQQRDAIRRAREAKRAGRREEATASLRQASRLAAAAQRRPTGGDTLKALRKKEAAAKMRARASMSSRHSRFAGTFTMTNRQSKHQLVHNLFDSSGVEPTQAARRKVRKPKARMMPARDGRKVSTAVLSSPTNPVTQASAMLSEVMAAFLAIEGGDEGDEDNDELTSPYLALVTGLKQGFARDTHLDGHQAWRRYFYVTAFVSHAHRIAEGRRIDAAKRRRRRAAAAKAEAAKRGGEPASAASRKRPLSEGEGKGADNAKKAADDREVQVSMEPILASFDIWNWTNAFAKLRAFEELKFFDGMPAAVYAIKEKLAFLADMGDKGGHRERKVFRALSRRVFGIQERIEIPAQVLRHWKPLVYTRQFMAHLIEVNHLLLKKTAAMEASGVKVTVAAGQVKNADGEVETRTKLIHFDGAGHLRQRLNHHVVLDAYTDMLSSYRHLSAKTLHHVAMFFTWYLDTTFPEAGVDLDGNPITYRSALYTMPMLLACNALLNDATVNRRSAYKTICSVARRITRAFFADASSNHALFVDVLFKRTTRKQAEECARGYVDKIRSGGAAGDAAHSEDELAEGAEKDAGVWDSDAELEFGKVDADNDIVIREARSSGGNGMRRWTDAEDALLKKLYPVYQELSAPYQFMSTHAGLKPNRRTAQQIERRLRKLKIVRGRVRVPMTREEQGLPPKPKSKKKQPKSKQDDEAGDDEAKGKQSDTEAEARPQPLSRPSTSIASVFAAAREVAVATHSHGEVAVEGRPVLRWLRRALRVALLARASHSRAGHNGFLQAAFDSESDSGSDGDSDSDGDAAGEAGAGAADFLLVPGGAVSEGCTVAQQFAALESPSVARLLRALGGEPPSGAARWWRLPRTLSAPVLRGFRMALVDACELDAHQARAAVDAESDDAEVEAEAEAAVDAESDDAEAEAGGGGVQQGVHDSDADDAADAPPTAVAGTPRRDSDGESRVMTSPDAAPSSQASRKRRRALLESDSDSDEEGEHVVSSSAGRGVTTRDLGSVAPGPRSRRRAVLADSSDDEDGGDASDDATAAVDTGSGSGGDAAGECDDDGVASQATPQESSVPTQAVGTQEVETQPATALTSVPDEGEDAPSTMEVPTQAADDVEDAPSTVEVPTQAADEVEDAPSTMEVPTQAADEVEDAPSTVEVPRQAADEVEDAPSTVEVPTQAADEVEDAPSTMEVPTQAAHEVEDAPVTEKQEVDDVGASAATSDPVPDEVETQPGAGSGTDGVAGTVDNPADPAGNAGAKQEASSASGVVPPPPDDATNALFDDTFGMVFASLDEPTSFAEPDLHGFDL